MNTRPGAHRARPVDLFPPAIAVVLAIVAHLVTGERSLSPDGASYLAITEHWVNGDWSGAFNGYWSPLLSVLLIPLVASGVPPTTAGIAFSVVLAGAAVAAVQYTMRSLAVDPVITTILALGAVPVAVFAALDNLTPDLLMGVLLLVFVAGVVSGAPSPWVTGLAGGAAFLAKAYALPVTVVFVVVASVWRVVERRTQPTSGRDPLGSLARVAAVTGTVSVAWIIVVSVDAGYPTVSTASEYNREISAPGSPGNPYGWAGLIEPDTRSAFWGWEDPTEMVSNVIGPSTSSGATASGGPVVDDPPPGTSGRLDRVVDNGVVAVKTGALAAGSMVAAALATVCAVITWRRRSSRHHRDILLSAAAATIYVGGLLVLVVSARYLFFVLLLAPVITGSGLDAIARRGKALRSAALALATIVAVGTAVRPAVAIVRFDDTAQRFASVDQLFSEVDVSGTRLASYPARLSAIGSRCLESDCVYLGAPRPNSNTTVAEQLVAAEVDVFVLQIGVTLVEPPDAPLVASSPEAGYAIYDVSGLD